MIEWVAINESDLIQRMTALNVEGNLYNESYYHINSINGQFDEWISQLASVYHKSYSVDSFRIWYDANDQVMRLMAIRGNAGIKVKIIEKFMPPQLLEVYNELKKVKTIQKSIG